MSTKFAVPDLMTNRDTLSHLLLMNSLVVHSLLVDNPILVAVVLDLVEGSGDGMKKTGKLLVLTSDQR